MARWSGSEGHPMAAHLPANVQVASLRVFVPTFRYDTEAVLRDVQIEFSGPGLVALIGPNGSGKSTLLKIAAGLIHPKGAAIVVCGKPLESIPPRELAALVAWVPQRSEVIFAMTVREMVCVGRYRVERPMRSLPASMNAAIDLALEEVGLTDLAEREVETLSGGEWQRAMIARAIAQETPVLLLDEPIASLDLRYQDDIYLLLGRLASAGRLILVADHHLEVAAAHAGRLILLRAGQISADGAPADILTAERIEATFGVRAHVFPDPFTGTPRVSRVVADR
jgi:ABC-type cobalamin/Fe3+-siderophores transport system ATPase subunit